MIIVEISSNIVIRSFEGTVAECRDKVFSWTQNENIFDSMKSGFVRNEGSTYQIIKPDQGTEEISVSWCFNDVMDTHPKLTKEQAIEVLQVVRRRHDAEFGINWEVIRETATSMFPGCNKLF